MPTNYDHSIIEPKWQQKWEEAKLFCVKEDSTKKKLYVLDMFPYPSAAGLHVGHPEGYTATDIVCRKRMMEGFNVLHPMGFDSFGLPAENYALKTGVHPAVSTAANIASMRTQIKRLGFAYDWSREVITSDPAYYKWTQWIFLQLFKAGLAYKSVAPINWCPSCKTGLANEEVVDGKCDRCGTPTVKKEIPQWMLKITAYADRLLEDLKLLDWPESIKEQQRNWIGRSEGARIKFRVQWGEAELPKEAQLQHIEVFTTRADTLFGATYVVVAPEHPLIANSISHIANSKEVEEYITESKKKSDLQRTDLAKEKTGVELKGIKAINPANGEELPVWVADYVLASYGTGAVMAVPAHDERDFEFAKKYGLGMKPVIVCHPERSEGSLAHAREPASAGDSSSRQSGTQNDKQEEKAFISDGTLVNSAQFSGMSSDAARTEITAWLAKDGKAKATVQYKLRDWVFSRQRYWGEPIPLVFCETCKEYIPVPENQLPLELPQVERYEPTGTGESPLAAIESFVNTTCPKCDNAAKRETNTMPQWAGSCWYYIAFAMGGDTKFMVRQAHHDNPVTLSLSKGENWDRAALDYWLKPNGVDLYVGGAEHAVLHLLYARFWHKFLFDKGFVPHPEPFYKLLNQGLILGEGGVKMSKSLGNVVNPDDVIAEYGADTLRMYEMFMGPFQDSKPWSTKGIVGIRRFLEKVWKLKERVSMSGSSTSSGSGASEDLERILHKTIKKVGEDIDAFKFNTAISALMVLTNAMMDEPALPATSYKLLLQLLSPFAPHITEELWEQLGKSQSIIKEMWPAYDPALVTDDTIDYVIQVNAKLRDQIKTSADITQDELLQLALASAKVQAYLKGVTPKQVIFVKGRLINLVV